jgi:hypothetical protein
MLIFVPILLEDQGAAGGASDLVEIELAQLRTQLAEAQAAYIVGRAALVEAQARVDAARDENIAAALAALEPLLLRRSLRTRCAPGRVLSVPKKRPDRDG